MADKGKLLQITISYLILIIIRSSWELLKLIGVIYYYIIYIKLKLLFKFTVTFLEKK